MISVIRFHDAELLGEQDGDSVWIPVRPICEAIGIHTEKQTNRIKEDEILGPIHTVRYALDAANRQFPMVCLPIGYVHGWLFSIDPNKVRANVKPHLLLFKQECYTVLYEHFFGNARRLQVDAEREHFLLGRNKEINRHVRELMAEQGTNKLELQSIQNRRAITYHLDPVYAGVEVEFEKRKFLGKQTTIDLAE